MAAAPKAGSTFLVNTLIRITRLRGFRLCAAYSTNEHDLYLPALCLMNRYGCVSQLHMKGTFHNAALMRTFGIRPIILVRRIEDIVASLQHDLRGKAQKRSVGTGRVGYSFVWQDQTTRDLSDERLLDMIIDLAVPWFVNFYVSWHRLCEQGAVDALWVTYEELFADKEKTVRQVLDFLGLHNGASIDPAILSRKYRTFRDGSVGRGRRRSRRNSSAGCASGSPTTPTWTSADTGCDEGRLSRWGFCGGELHFRHIRLWQHPRRLEHNAIFGADMRPCSARHQMNGVELFH